MSNQDRPQRARLIATPPPIQHVPVPVPAQPLRRGRLWLLPFVLLLVVVTGLLASYTWLYRSDQIFPAVYADGVSVGQRSRADAQALLATRWAQQTVTLRDGESLHLVPLADMGVVQDSAEMARLAYLRGRVWDDPAQVWHALQGGSSVGAVYFPVDMDRAQATLTQLSTDLSNPAVNASVALENGRAIDVAAQSGRTLDVEATLAQWRGGLGTVLRERVLDLVFYPVEPAVTDVSALVGEINTRLATPLTVRAYDPVRDERLTWPVSAETWVNWLTFDVVNGRVVWQIDAAGVSDFIAEKDAQLDGQRFLLDADASTIGRAIENGQSLVDLRIYHAPTTHIVQSGETLSSIGYSYGIPYPWLQQANPGVDFLTVGQAITVPSPDEFLPLPVVENKRVLISLSQQRMWGYENGALVWDQTISTGIDDSPTHPGVFQVQSHEREAYANAWDLYMPYFMGIYQPGPNAGVMNGFHGFPTRDGYNLLWTNNLGTPVTYGCVLINNTIAPAFYAWAEEGVVVEIVP